MNIDMENKVNNLLAEAANRIAIRAEENKGYEYEGFWLTLNFAVVRGGHAKKIGLRALGLYITLRTFMNKDKIAYPKLTTLRNTTGLSINTIRKDIDRLVENGWIRKTVKKNNKGKFAVTIYTILQTDLIRGTGDPSFRRCPVSRINIGIQPEPVSNNHNGQLIHK